MSGRTLARRVARTGAAALPAGARAALFRGLAPRLGVGGSEHGLVSVVLVCEPVDLPRLPDTLASLAEQPHGYREVLLVPVGDAPEPGSLLGANRDPRLRVLPAAATWQAAVNRGIASAHGRFLFLQRACDPVPPAALPTLAASLAGSGSDLAIGHVAQRGQPEEWLARTQLRAHARPGIAVAPGTRPELAGDLALGNRLVRTATWQAAGPALDDTDDWLESPAVARLLVAVDRVDVLDLAVTEYLPDHGQRAFGAEPSSLPELPARHARVAQVERALADTTMLDGWRGHVLDIELPRFLKDAERATDDEWAELRALVASYAGGEVEPDLVRAESRTLIRLATEDRRSDLEALVAEAHDLGHELRTVVEDGRVLARWDAVRGLPVDTRTLSAAETPLLAEVRRLRRIEAGLELDLALRVAQVDLAAVPATLTATVAGQPAQELRARVDADATRWSQSRFQAALAATVRVPAEATELLLTLTAAGLERTTTVPLADPTTRDPAADHTVTVTGLRLTGSHLVVDADGAATMLLLVDDADRVIARAAPESPQRVRFSLRVDGPRHGGWLPAGHYRLRTPRGNPGVADELVGSLPFEQVGRRHRLRARLGPFGGLVTALGPPLEDDEQGPWAQQRLIERYTAADAAVRTDTLYFESYAGRSATDSPLAIFTELHGHRPDLTAYWGVSDHAQWVPDGATPVLIRSREWFDLLASAGCLVVNTDFEPWFRRRPGQFVLQTFHGYPSKGMGEGQWRAKQLPPSRMATLRARGVDTWSAILTPTPEMTRHYREQYGYEGIAFDRGYPRDDDLSAPGAAARRQAVRSQLGIRDDQTAVLYAPTWRDHLATRPRVAEMADHLDVQRAAAALGDSHVLLLRGHRFHEPEPVGVHVLDVTGHPEVNDLILAADVAVLDYSSLRFDFALTGKPMVFLVPDLADYGSGTRSFLFPFEASAPGPLVDDTDAVVELVRDTPALRARWADRLAAFNAEYQPWQDGHAAARVVDGLLALLDLPTP